MDHHAVCAYRFACVDKIASKILEYLPKGVENSCLTRYGLFYFSGF